MKGARLELLLQMPILLLGFAATASAQNMKVAALSDRDVQAKLEYCKTCHGVYGQGYHGAFPIPRLAGQQPDYVENQLRAFQERRRENKFMFTVTHVLSPEMVKAIAAQFKDLDPKPLGGAPRELAAQKDLRRRNSRGQCPPMRQLSWSGRERERAVSAFGGSAE